MGSLLVVLAHQVVSEERLSATRRAKYELVSVGGNATLHRLIGNIQVDGLTRKTVNHLYAEWRARNGNLFRQ